MRAFSTSPSKSPASAPSTWQPVGLRAPKRALQTKLELGAVDDPLEREADRVADQVMRTPARATLMSDDGSSLRRTCEACADDEAATSCSSCGNRLSRKESDSVSARGAGSVPSIVEDVLSSPGQPLDTATRDDFGSRFGHDFSRVRVHTSEVAGQSANAVGALAYTVGPNIAFASGNYAPTESRGRRLLAHELAHVVQQGAAPRTPATAQQSDDSGGATSPAARVDTIARADSPLIQRLSLCTLAALPDASTDDMCTPYSSPADVSYNKAYLRANYLPVDGAVFGANSRMLYESYLSRRPGDSLAPVVFDDPTSDVVDSFATSGATASDGDAILELVGARLSRVLLNDDTLTMFPLSRFVTPAEQSDRPINYSNPLSIAGHIAGGTGSSDAGPDTRTITGGMVSLTKTPLAGGVGYVAAEVTLHYDVFDTIDFCPGDSGSPAEGCITVPMSRLEASGAAYDTPFLVRFIADSRSDRFWYS